MNKPVSIIIPCYNSEPFLAATLESIVSQDYPNIEVILVDDGSADGSVEVAATYESRIDLRIINQPNAGVSAARNNGFQHSKGDYVIFLDSDDVLLPQFVSSKVKLLENTEFNCAGSRIYNFTDDSAISTENTSAISVHDSVKSDLLNYDARFSSVPSSFLFRSDLFKKSTSTPFNLLLMSTADRYLLVEYADRLKIVLDHSPDSGLLYRIRKDSMSNVYNQRLIDDNALFYKELLRNGLLSRKELRTGYVMLIKSYAKIRLYGACCGYVVKLAVLRFSFSSPKQQK